MNRIFLKIARENGVSVKRIKADMQEAILAAWSKPNKTEAERRRQAEIPCRGTVPTPEEFIRYYAERISKS